MIVIHQEKCTGCGLCAKDCVSKNIVIADEKAAVKSESCLKCGHCIAVCPRGAVSTDEYDMGEVKEYDQNAFAIGPERLLNFIRFRRSVRQFKEQPVEHEKLLRIIEAGRFTATGGNRQDVSYIVVQENIPQLRNLALERLSETAKAALLQPQQNPALLRFAQRWTAMYESDREQPGKGDGLFFNAPAVLLIVSDSTVDAALAASNMELMTAAQGLGAFYSGFFVRSAQHNAKISKLLGLADSQEIKVCLVLGYPAVQYFRTVPRKTASILWR